MRYMLFAGENYYPSGGMEDLVGHAATMVDTIALLGRRSSNGYLPRQDWFNIYDTIADVVYKYSVFRGMQGDQLKQWAVTMDAEATHVDMVKVLD